MYVCKTLFQYAIFANYLHQLSSTKGVRFTLNLKYITKHTLNKLLIININLKNLFPLTIRVAELPPPNLHLPNHPLHSGHEISLYAISPLF